MSEQSLFTVVAYDVSDDKRRRKLVNVLESFGVRAQESVFEAWLNDQERKRMETRARKILDPAVDRLGIYVLPKVDREAIISLGQGVIAPNPSHWIL